jgi:hypothetical protein
MADDLRARRLRALDAHSRDFLAHAGETGGVTGPFARRELDILASLADQVIRSLAQWRERVGDLDLSVRSPFSLPLAARAVTEAVFDDILEPEATRVFAAAIDLAL